MDTNIFSMNPNAPNSILNSHDLGDCTSSTERETTIWPEKGCESCFDNFLWFIGSILAAFILVGIAAAIFGRE